jgi:hypothetical protein
MVREVLDLQRRVLGPEHPGTLTTMGNLAACLNGQGLALAVEGLEGQGKLAEAEEMLREVLGVKRRVLGPEHPDTLEAMHNLGCPLSGQGKHAEAEQMFREVLGVRRRVLGVEHPHTLATLRVLTSLYSTRSTLWSWTCSVSTSVWKFLARALIASRAAAVED